MTAPTVAVLGGGISGLVAAYRLRGLLGAKARIVVVDPDDRLGGKLRTVDLLGGPVDVGAEAFVARRPEIPALLAELGLSDELVRPSTTARPLIRSAGTLHPLPVGTLMGIPATSESVRSLVDDETCRRIDAERTIALRWTVGGDGSVGDLVSERFGPQVTARSVDPLLGGVYSGLSETTSIRAALPTLAAALDAGATSLGAAVERARPTAAPGPVFGGLRRGYGVLLDELRRASGAEIVRASAAVRPASGGRWDVDAVGTVDGVVLATPAPVASALLEPVAREAARLIGTIDVASSAVVVLGFGAVELPDNSGVLVATDDTAADGHRLRAKAFTLSTRKWPHLAEREGHLVRVSFGRFGDAAVVDLPDEDLVAAARADLATVFGVSEAPSLHHVQRWHGGLPQYRPGHTALSAAVLDAVAAVPRLDVAGAYVNGVGVPACVAAATAAATRLAADLV